MTKRQTVISILALVVIAACIVVAMMYPPILCASYCGAYRSAALRNGMYLAAVGVGVLAVILALSPWGRSKD